MEHDLCEAAITGDTKSFHVATLSEQTDFVVALLNLKPELKLRLTEVLDSQQRSALHLASAKGYDQIGKELVKANPKMCLVRDRDSKNAVHVAAMEGKTSVLEELVRASPEAARVRVDQNETILHLCVKRNQLESLEKLLDIIQGQDFVNAKDNDGNTILHLAILYKRLKIVSHVLKKKTINVNATNASGNTIMDLLFLEPNKKEVEPFEDILRQANAERAKDLVGGDWLMKKRDSLMVVASLIATMAFHAAVNLVAFGNRTPIHIEPGKL